MPAAMLKTITSKLAPLSLKGKEPPLTKIYVEPTTLCNLNCPMCMRHSWDEPGGSMPMATFRALLAGVRKVKSVKSFSFWGIGEPLMHPDIFKMIRSAKDSGCQTEMITNGILLTPERAKGLIRSGLDALIVSLEGTSPKSYEKSRESDFHLLMDNLEGFNRLKAESSSQTPKLGLEFVISKQNINELPALAGIAQRMDAQFIIISNLLPYDVDASDDILYWLATGDLNHTKIPVGTYPSLRLPRIDPRPEYMKPVEELKRNLSYSEEIEEFKALGFCPFVGRGAAAVRWDGSIAPCVPLMHSHKNRILNRRKAVTQYLLGNVKEQGLDQIWKMQEYRDFRKRVLGWEFPPCIQCDCYLAEENLEDCCCSPFPTCGDCLWAHNIVVCP